MTHHDVMCSIGGMGTGSFPTILSHQRRLLDAGPQCLHHSALQEDKPAGSQSPSRTKPCDAKKAPVSWGFHNRQTDSPLEETTSESIAEILSGPRPKQSPFVLLL